jgi:predicted ATP-grasp superfamily ATP-dependent carboligase
MDVRVNGSMKNTEQEPLLVVGASVRAAAFSAARAGYRPLAADLFNDVDLRRLCPSHRVVDYPHGLIAASRHFPAAPWIYTGGLENYPDIVDELAAMRPLLGNGGTALRAVRDPFQVAEALRQQDVSFPMTLPVSKKVSRRGDWLLKRIRSSGGSGVRIWRGQSFARSRAAEFVLQKRIDGRPCAAVFIAAQGDPKLVGVTEQLVGTPWCGARGFQYAGSIGPFRLNARQRDRWQRIGSCLASEFHLTGIFGVDAVATEHEIWPVEINPRYTASVEVLERALNIHAVRWHVDACREGRLPDLAATNTRPWCGKVILYAEHPTEIGRDLGAKIAELEQSPGDDLWPSVADIPQPQERIRSGRPIMTLFASARSRAALLKRLKQLAAFVRSQDTASANAASGVVRRL